MRIDAEQAVDAARAFAKIWNKGWVETAVVVEAEDLEGRPVWMVGVFEPDLDIRLYPEKYWTHMPVDIAYYVDPLRPSHIGFSHGRGIIWAPVTGPTEPRRHTDLSEL